MHPGALAAGTLPHNITIIGVAWLIILGRGVGQIDRASTLRTVKCWFFFPFLLSFYYPNNRLKIVILSLFAFLQLSILLYAEHSGLELRL